MKKTINQNRLSYIGSMIRGFRFGGGLSQNELADLSGTHVNTIKRLENNKCNVTLCNLYKIADGLEIDIRDLLLPDDD